MNYAFYESRFSKALERMGNLYTFEDIMEEIHESRMQSFAENDTWVVTSVHDYPRRRVLDVVFVVGDMADAEKLHDKVIEFAKEIGATMVRAYGRDGWLKHADKNGWSIINQVYCKEL